MIRSWKGAVPPGKCRSGFTLLATKRMLHAPVHEIPKSPHCDASPYENWNAAALTVAAARVARERSRWPTGNMMAELGVPKRQ